MLGISIRSTNRQSVITRKAVDSIRSSFKSTQLSTLKNQQTGKVYPQKGVQSIQVPEKVSAFNSKVVQNKVRTIQNSRKAPSAFSKMRRGGSLGGMNENLLFQRKQNHLNTCFNIRKNKLQEITKVNKQIYNRLNSQKSLYSNSDLNKSYQSIQVIKDRLSQSKVSQRSNLSRQSSRNSLRNSKSMRAFPNNKAITPQIQVKAQNINQVEAKDLDKFRILFEKNTNVRNRQTIDSNGQELVKSNSYRKNGAYMRSIKVSGRVSIHSSKEGTKQVKPTEKASQQVGGLLHRIMEDWAQNKQNTSKKVK